VHLSPEVKELVITRIRDLSLDLREHHIQRGRLLKELNLSKKEYRTSNLRLSYSTARKLITIADSPRITDPQYQPNWEDRKPNAFRTLYEIAILPQKVFEAALAANAITKDCTRNQILRFKSFHQRGKRKASRKSRRLIIGVLYDGNDDVGLAECVEQIQQVADARSGAYVIAEVMDTADPVEGTWRIKVSAEQDALDEDETDFPILPQSFPSLSRVDLGRVLSAVRFRRWLACG
jgi:hypothetical protein